LSFDIFHFVIFEFLFVSARDISWIVLHLYAKAIHEETRSITKRDSGNDK
jgi:hypothetical protein